MLLFFSFSVFTCPWFASSCLALVSILIKDLFLMSFLLKLIWTSSGWFEGLLPCGKSFEEKYCLKIHFKSSYWGKVLEDVSLCKTIHQYTKTGIQHLKSYVIETRFPCKFCGTSFLMKLGNFPMKKLLPANECEVCDRFLGQQGELEKHTSGHCPPSSDELWLVDISVYWPLVGPGSPPSQVRLVAAGKGEVVIVIHVQKNIRE